MKNCLLIWIVSCCFLCSLTAQNNSSVSVSNITNSNCKDLIAADETIDGNIQVLKTRTKTLVKRKNYTYTIEFINDQRGIVAKVYSYNGVRLKKGDQIIFMDDSFNRGAYSFIEKGKKAMDGETLTHSNILKIDRTAIDWFFKSNKTLNPARYVSNKTITTIYIKDNNKNELRKFTIDESRSATFKQLANCFNLNLAKAN